MAQVNISDSRDRSGRRGYRIAIARSLEDAKQTIGCESYDGSMGTRFTNATKSRARPGRRSDAAAI